MGKQKEGIRMEVSSCSWPHNKIMVTVLTASGFGPDRGALYVLRTGPDTGTD